ncbi:MAG: ABC transporter substrate-binding protein [Planctomycetes bacterium]|nr:ABC transporter substrate-binding protein [Planctomycetota bacterium]
MKTFDATRRAFLTGLAAAGVGYAFWPRRPRDDEEVPNGRTIVTYWEKWTGIEGAAIQRVVDRFNSEQDRYWVQRVAVSDIREKAMLAIAGGDPPDVVGLFSYNIPQHAEAGALLPLEAIESADAGRPASGSSGASTRSGLERYAPAVRELLSYDGRQWGGISTGYTLALYYNKKHFRDAGLDPERPPRTIADLDAATEALTVRSRDGEIERAGFLPNIPWWWPYFWPIPFGGTLFDAARNRATLDIERNIAAFEWIGSFPRRFGGDAVRAFGSAFLRSYHSAQDPFLSGRMAMIAQGPWLANFIRQYAPDLEYGVAPFPVAESVFEPGRPAGLLEADVLLIPRGCRNPQAAREFVQFAQRQDVHEQLCCEHFKASGLFDASERFLRDHPNPYVGVFDAVTKSPRAQALPMTRVWPQYAERIQGAFDAIWAGADAATTLRRTNAEVQALLDAAEKRRKRNS